MRRNALMLNCFVTSLKMNINRNSENRTQNVAHIYKTVMR
jgi:hypothetical protein